MLKHTALFKFGKFENAREQEKYYNRIRTAFNGLDKRVPAIKCLQIGFDKLESKNSYDFVVNVDLENMDALADYMNHPEHIKAGQVVRERMTDKKTIDYEF